jgi:hypothetical protein
MTFYIAIETPAQIEKYSFTIRLNLGRASLTLAFNEIFLFAPLPSLPRKRGAREGSGTGYL